MKKNIDTKGTLKVEDKLMKWQSTKMTNRQTTALIMQHKNTQRLSNINTIKKHG